MGRIRSQLPGVATGDAIGREADGRARENGMAATTGVVRTPVHIMVARTRADAGAARWRETRRST